MKKLLVLLVITAIHYSALGNYLVNQDGKRVTIQGHPHMVCYRKHGELRGTFIKANGSTIWLKANWWNGNEIEDWNVEIKNPVCDLK